MSLQDSIADFLTRIRNAQQARKEKVIIAFSKQKVAIAKLLKEEGYISYYKIIDENSNSNKLSIKLGLKYYLNKPVISKLKRVSRPSLRIYKPCKELPRVMGGLGVAVISTSKGIMSCRKARYLGIGGEVLCFVE